MYTIIVLYNRGIIIWYSRLTLLYHKHKKHNNIHEIMASLACYKLASNFIMHKKQASIFLNFLSQLSESHPSSAEQPRFLNTRSNSPFSTESSSVYIYVYWSQFISCSISTLRTALHLLFWEPNVSIRFDSILFDSILFYSIRFDWWALSYDV